MKFILINEPAFKYYSGFSQTKINSSEKATITQQNNNLIINVNNQLAAKLDLKKLLIVEEFDEKLICCYVSPEGFKKIIFELFASHDAIYEIKLIINRINKHNSYKSPLAFDVSIKNRDSVYSNPDKPADLKGFINLFILFSLLNYSRLIIEHVRKYKLVFFTNVRS